MWCDMPNMFRVKYMSTAYQRWENYPQSPVETTDYPFQIIFSAIGSPSGVEIARLIAYKYTPMVFWRTDGIDTVYVWPHHWYETASDVPVSYQLEDGVWEEYSGEDDVDDVYLKVDGVDVRAFEACNFDIYSAMGEGEEYLSGQMIKERDTLPTHSDTTYQWWHGAPRTPDETDDYPYQALIRVVVTIDEVEEPATWMLVVSQSPLYLSPLFPGVSEVTSSTYESNKVYDASLFSSILYAWQLVPDLSTGYIAEAGTGYGPPEIEATVEMTMHQNLGDIFDDSSLSTVAYPGNIDVVLVREVIAQPLGGLFAVKQSLVDATASTVQSGYYFSAGIRKDGTIWSAGFNEYGQLGVGDYSDRTEFTQSGAIKEWVKLACGGWHMMAIQSDGTLYGTGSEVSIGAGYSYTRNTFTQIGTETDWETVSCGYYQTMAIKTDGTLWGAGYNSSGELGTGDNSIKYTFTKIGTATNWKAVECGTGHTMAIKTDGTLWGTGWNLEGQLGLGDNADRNTFTQIGEETDWEMVSCGTAHTMAIKTDGTLWGTGRNGTGHLGLDDEIDRNTFTQIGVSTDWKSVSCGGDHTMAIKTDGTLWGTGFNQEGQLGLGDRTKRLSFTQVGVATDWEYARSGHSDTMAKNVAGELFCMGRNHKGQLGLGDTARRISIVSTEISGPYMENSIIRIDLDWRAI